MQQNNNMNANPLPLPAIDNAKITPQLRMQIAL